MLSKYNNNIILFLEKYHVDKDGTVFGPTGCKRKLKYNHFGYAKVTFKSCGKVLEVFVHRVQAYLKFGNVVFEAECVRHLNGNPKDNSWNNIEIGSHSQNQMDKTDEMRKLQAEIATSHIRRFTKDQVREIRDEHAKGSSMLSLARKYDCPKSTMSCVINKKTYKDI